MSRLKQRKPRWVCENAATTQVIGHGLPMMDGRLVLCRGWFDKWGGMVHAERGHESAGFPSMATQAWAMPSVQMPSSSGLRAGVLSLWTIIKVGRDADSILFRQS